MRTKLLLSFLIGFLFMSCTNKEYEQKIAGKWKTVNWEVEQSGEKLDGQMNFTFENDGTYTLDYGSKIENGKFWITDDVLHTQAEGGVEIIVRITQLTEDSLGFQMNRGGTIEVVDLARER
ncbi:MAG: lipocalin family protein [Bacteroidia bacterium]